LSNKSRIFLNSIIVTSATVADKVLFLFITIIIARYLTVENYGEYTTALGYATFFAACTNLGINQVLVRHINLFPAKEKIHFANSLVFKLWVCAIAFIIMMAILPFTGYNRNIIYLIFILAFVRFGTEFQRVFYTFYEAKEKFSTSSSFTNLFSVSLLLVTIAATTLNGDYYAISFSRLALVILFLAALLIFTQKKYNTVSIKTENLKGFITESIPFGLTTILQQNIIGNINLLIISIILGSTYSGLFNNALVFFKVFFFIPGSISIVILPFLYKQQFTQEKEKYNFSYSYINKILGFLSFYIFLIFYLFAEEILTLVFGIKYIKSVPMLKILTLAIPFVFNIGTIIITALNRQVIVTWIYFFAAIINITGCIILTKFLGLTGASLSIVFAYFFIFISSTLYLKFIHAIEINPTIIAYVKLSVISLFLVFIHSFSFINSIHWMLQAFIISILYCIMLFILIIRKDDIRIVREVLKI
jgi:O-antigen/teichoic acid export membrane protein